jgi:hypothetical protein
MNRKIIFYFFLGGGIGFFIHAFFFPTYLTHNWHTITNRTINKKQAPLIDTTNQTITHVVFEEGEFDPQVVVIRKSYYLGIVNNSDTELMTLTSEQALLITLRGYGKSEEHIAQLYEPGEYTVSSLLHPDRNLKVIVK